MKHKSIKIILIVFSVIIALVAIVALGISSFAKSYIEKNSKELIGRQVQMKDLKINIFTGTLYLDSLLMYEKNDTDVFASVDSFYMNLELLKLLESKIEIAELKIIGPHASIIQKGETFNFDDLIPTDDTTSVTEEPSSFPKSVVIRNILVKGGLLEYSDLLVNNTIRMKDLGVAIPELSFEQGNTNAGIHLRIGDSATLDSQLTMDMQTNEYLLNLKVGNLPIDIIQPYLKDYFNLGKLEGFVNSDLQVKGNLDHVADFTISGTADANNFNLTNSLGEPLISVKDASVKMNSIYLTKDTYLFDKVEAKGVKLDFILHPKTDNFTSFFKAENDSLAADTTSVPMILKIGNLHITGSELSYTDRTLKSGVFNLPISNVDFLATNFDIDKTNKYEVKASVPHGGKIGFTWIGNINDTKNQEITGNFRNISLKLFTPYCLDYTAYDITKGNMNFTTRNRIANNYINSINKIDVYDMSVGKKHKEIKAEYNVPLKLGLYILKDKDGKIQFDVPVKGNIDDPEFSYKKIIFKTIVNLMVKVAVSPVRFLASQFGLNPDEMSSMQIEALENEISAQQYSQLNELANMYSKKPEMAVSLDQYVNWNQAIDNFVTYQAKTSFLSSRTPKAEGEAAEYKDLQKMVKDDDIEYQNFINDLLAKKGQSTASNLTMKDKLFVIYPKDSIQSSLSRKLEKRNTEIKSYLNSTGGIPLEKLSVKTAATDYLLQYSDHDQYKINMTLPEDTQGNE